MNVADAMTFLFDLKRYPPRPGIDATRDLLAHLGDPQEAFSVVQVAGSNGKGSTARMTERVLRAAGLDVGLYTSPHIDDVRERIRVNGRMIPKESVRTFAERVENYVIDRAIENESPTFFEALTALACFEFGRRDVDVAVLEVGIGGRYDATSALSPAASAVTNVSLEHTEMLGESVEEIAADLAHVASDDRPLVTAATGSARAAIEDQAGATYTIGESEANDVRVEYHGREGIEGRVSLTGPDWAIDTRLGLLGAHQARNAGVAAALARQLGEKREVAITEAALSRGLRQADWPARFEIVERDPLIVLDGAHNPAACETLTATLEGFDYENLTVVFGAMYDKDYAGMIAALPTPDRVLTTRPILPRAEDPAALARVFERTGMKADAIERETRVATALETAIEEAGANDCVLVTGSLYTVADARSRWYRTLKPTGVEDRSDAAAALGRAGVGEATRKERIGELVTETIETRASARAARDLATAMDRLGGTGVRSGIEAPKREGRPVVLSGTHAQFARLVARIERGALPAVPRSMARGLCAQLGFETGDAETGASGDSAQRSAPWTDRTAVMGILNTTPDSFHDGGRYEAVSDAVARAEEMAEAGVDVIDVGGESTRPGADPVSVHEEIERVEPVIERISDLDALVSIDTRKAAVGRVALEAGADVLNDVTGLEDPEMRFLAAEYDAPIIVMHSIDAPVVAGKDVPYDDVVSDGIAELTERIALAEAAGVARENVIVDPGIGFGKSAAESFELLDRIDEFHALGCPVLAGHSHKSMFDPISDDSGAATVAGSAIAAQRGADIVRVHDVAENVAAVRVADATSDPGRFVEET